MFVTLLITIGILTVCIILMSIQTILKKDGQFPNAHIGNSPELKRRGIHCAKTQDREATKKKNLFEYFK